MTNEKRKKLLFQLTTLEQLNILKDNNSTDVYIVESEFSKLTSILNFLGSIESYFEYSPVTDEYNKLIEFHIIIHDYACSKF